MPEPRTHYQISFTSRQAVFLFAVLLASLAGAYFLGIATGVAGRPPAGTATPAPAPTRPVVSEKAPAGAVSPSAVAAAGVPESRTPAPAIAAREPSAGGGIQFFEDRPEEPTPAVSQPPRKAAAARAPEGYWVQVLSTSSERDAKSHRERLAARGYRAAVSEVRAAKGPALYRVRIGPYASREEASKAAEAFQKEKVKPWIVPPGD